MFAYDASILFFFAIYTSERSVRGEGKTTVSYSGTLATFHGQIAFSFKSCMQTAHKTERWKKKGEGKGDSLIVIQFNYNEKGCLPVLEVSI